MIKLKYFILLVILSSLISCEKEKDIETQPESNMTFLVGDTIGNYKLENYVVEKQPKSQDGMYFDSEIYGLSLEGSFQPELRFEVGISGGGYDYYGFCYCQSLSDWEICIEQDDTLNIDLLEKGDTLQSLANWRKVSNKDYVFATYTYYENFPNSTKSTGLWNESQDGYMGIRRIDNNDTTYGWIRLDITEKYKMTVKDFAIESNN